METTQKRIGKRGPLPKSPEHNLSESINIRVIPGVKHIYKSLAENFGLTETDLFYNLLAMGKFIEMIMPEIEKQLKERTTIENEEKNALWLARFKTQIKAFSLMSDLEDKRKYVRGKNQKTNPKQVAEIGEFLVDYLEKKFKSV